MGDGAGVLKFIGQAEIEVAVDLPEELGVDKELFLVIAFFGAFGCVVAQAPEVVGVIAIRSLETGYLVFFREEDGAAEDEDQLFAERIQTQQIDVGGSDVGGIVFSGLEEEGGDAAKAPVGFEGADGEGEGEEAFRGFGGSCDGECIGPG